jgi:cytochrome P450
VASRQTGVPVDVIPAGEAGQPKDIAAAGIASCERSASARRPTCTRRGEDVSGVEDISTNPLRGVLREWRTARRAPAPFPPGDMTFSLARTRRFMTHPLELMLEAYARYGPVFTLGIGPMRFVVALGPQANHEILVSKASSFRHRDSGMSILIPLLGDGLLTTDGDFHRRSRQIMLPAFHRDRLVAVHAVMREEAKRARARWSDGAHVEIYRWAHDLALRVAMRGLLGLDPDTRRNGIDPRAEFARAFGYFSHNHLVMQLRGPSTPFARMMGARRRLDVLVFGEIARRRHTGERGDDVLSLLLDAQDEDGLPLSDRHVRDEAMTVLTAGHATTTSTISLLLYELARNPEWADRVASEVATLGHDPGAADLLGGELPALDLVLQETLRIYPAAWIGARRCVETCTLAGVTVPAGALVHYSPWASHMLPDVWEQPEAFRPERFSGNARAGISRGAYVPFGAGSRTCIGMRFGELTVRTVVAHLMRDVRLELAPDYHLDVRPQFALAPKGGLPMRVTR